MNDEILYIKRTEDGLELSMVNLREIENNELEKIKNWLWEIFNEVQEELADRHDVVPEEEERDEYV